jgi:hypothetical protein
MKKTNNRLGTRLFLHGWSRGVASIALSYMVASPSLKAQEPTQPPVSGGSAPNAAGAATEVQPTPPADQLQPALPPPTLQAIKPKKNEVSASADFMLGQGTLTLPVGYSLAKSLNGTASPQKGAAKPTRSSDYFGGTISYSYGQAWYFDFSYSHGSSSGNQVFPLFGGLPSTSNDFSLDDNWYQAYVRYAFPQLRGKRLSAYLRAGATYIDATLTDASTTPSGFYSQTDTTTEVRGNLGAGVTYSLYSSRKFRFGLQFEGEGYFGERSQSSQESLANTSLPHVTADINNTLFGGVGRAVAHFEYRFGRTGLFRAFLDGGAELDYTEIQYPSAGTYNELLWGPYVKLGFRYSF